jgi:hypothetical protein
MSSRSEIVCGVVRRTDSINITSKAKQRTHEDQTKRWDSDHIPRLMKTISRTFDVRSQHCEERLSASSSLLCCMEQLCFHRADFNAIWYLRIFRKSVERIQVLLKSDD